MAAPVLNGAPYEARACGASHTPPDGRTHGDSLELGKQPVGVRTAVELMLDHKQVVRELHIIKLHWQQAFHVTGAGMLRLFGSWVSMGT